MPGPVTDNRRAPDHYVPGLQRYQALLGQAGVTTVLRSSWDQGRYWVPVWAAALLQAADEALLTSGEALALLVRVKQSPELFTGGRAAQYFASLEPAGEFEVMLEWGRMVVTQGVEQALQTVGQGGAP